MICRLIAFPTILLLVSPAYAQSAIKEDATIRPAGSVDFERAAQCLSLAIAYEAGYEPAEGQQAVAEVVLNRTRHPAYPKSVCGVVFQGSARKTGCQFTFTCDGAMKRTLPAKIMQNSRSVAERVLSSNFTPFVGGATHYHANYVSPYWAPSLIRVGKIGAHIFYRAPGSVDQSARYNGGFEPLINGLGSWALAPDKLTMRPKAQTTQKIQTPRETVAFAPWGLAAPQ